MAAYTVTTSALAGVAYTMTAVAASDTFANDGRTLLIVTNADASPSTVTITAQNKADGLTITNPTAVVTNGTTEVIGPFPPRYFNDSTGAVTVSYSNTTSVTAAAIKLGNT